MSLLITSLPIMVALWAAQSAGPPAPPPPVERVSPTQRDCDGDPSRQDQVVVCGRRGGDSPYRLAPEFRERPDRSSGSWSSHARDMREVDRYDSQNVGAGGALQRSRQTDCEWRAERQQLRGEQVDCTRSVRSPISE